jgi:hypothetical protein
MTPKPEFAFDKSNYKVLKEVIGIPPDEYKHLLINLSFIIPLSKPSTFEQITHILNLCTTYKIAGEVYSYEYQIYFNIVGLSNVVLRQQQIFHSNLNNFLAAIGKYLFVSPSDFPINYQNPEEPIPYTLEIFYTEHEQNNNGNLF